MTDSIYLDLREKEALPEVLTTTVILSVLLQAPLIVSGGSDSQVAMLFYFMNTLDALNAGQVEVLNDVIRFQPSGRVESRTLAIDVGSSLSAFEILTALILPCTLCDGKVRLKIRGVTEGTSSSTFAFWNYVCFPLVWEFR